MHGTFGVSVVEMEMEYLQEDIKKSMNFINDATVSKSRTFKYRPDTNWLGALMEVINKTTPQNITLKLLLNVWSIVR